MSGGLLNQFASVHKDQCLRGVRTRRVDTINQLCENNLSTISLSLPRYLAYLLSCHFQLLGIRLVFCDRGVCTKALTECILPDIAGDARVRRPGHWD